MYCKIKHIFGWETTRREFTESNDIKITGDPFIVSPSLTALSHRKPAFAGVSRESCRAQGRDKKGTPSITVELRQF
jgi:hypothetical protein